MWQTTFLMTLTLYVGHTSGARNYWMDAPYGNDSYNERVQYGHNFTLECEDGIAPPGRVLYWIRPDLKVMMPNDSESFWTLDGYAGWEVSSDGTAMFFTVLQESQFGFYHCVIYDAPNYYAVKKGVNYKGPYFGDLWIKYRMPTIIGLSSMGGFLVLALALMLVCIYKCPGAPTDMVDEDHDIYEGTLIQDEDQKSGSGVFTNQGFDRNDDGERPSTSRSSSGASKRSSRAHVYETMDTLKSEMSTAL